MKILRAAFHNAILVPNAVTAIVEKDKDFDMVHRPDLQMLVVTNKKVPGRVVLVPEGNIRSMTALVEEYSAKPKQQPKTVKKAPARAKKKTGENKAVAKG